jgi:hypothetical protein
MLFDESGCQSAGQGWSFAGFGGQARLTVFVTGGDEFAEERMRLQWLGFEFGVELAA